MGAVVEFLGYDPRRKEETVGERLKRHRETWRRSRQKLAEVLGVSESVLWRWESGRRHPTGKHLARIHARLEGEASTPPSTIGGQLRHHRWRLDLTMTDMARLLGVAQSTLCRWESGEREPTGARLVKVEEVLGKTLEQGPAHGR
jgi:DNA-binding transcriptional regulator YiaG